MNSILYAYGTTNSITDVGLKIQNFAQIEAILENLLSRKNKFEKS